MPTRIRVDSLFRDTTISRESIESISERAVHGRRASASRTVEPAHAGVSLTVGIPHLTICGRA